MCDFPLCQYPDYEDGLCIHHHKHFGKPKEKVKKPIPKQSAKRVRESKEYRRIVKELLSKSSLCELKSPVCTGKAQGLDHQQKRSPKNWLDVKNLKGCCNACNLYKESHPQWAKDNGFHVSRFKK